MIYPQQSLDELGVLIREKEKEFGHPIILVADDIYRRLVFDGLTSGDVLLSHPHSIRVHSHSKDLGLPGERIGFIAVHPGIPERETICQGLVLANRILGFVNAPALMQQILPSMGQATVDVSIYQTRVGFQWAWTFPDLDLLQRGGHRTITTRFRETRGPLWSQKMKLRKI